MIGDLELKEAVQLLPGWLPNQRWFAGKDVAIDRVHPVSATLLKEADPRVWHMLVEVRQADRTSVYQVPMVFRNELVERLDHVLIGSSGGQHVYDALHDHEAVEHFLQHFVADREVGDLTFHMEFGATVPLEEHALVLPVEQSNTSVVLGDEALLKAFRRVIPGTNPDVEVHDALTRAGSTDIATLLGWVDGSWQDGQGVKNNGTVAMLQAYLTTASDGWALAAASVRDLYAEGNLHADEVGGDFAAESHRLGVATAHVHRLMADVLPTSTMGPDDVNALADRINQQLSGTVEIAPDLAPHVAQLRDRVDAVRDIPMPVHAQRIHSDFHLGQVLRTVKGWKLIDFEGEPARPLSERTRLDSPLRDIAGMLRSFDYAARHLLVTSYPADDPGIEQISLRALEWTRRNSDAFCEGYAEVTGTDPREQADLLSAYEIDKAVYEVAYEARHRPAWLPIPLSAVERLAQGKSANQ